MKSIGLCVGLFLMAMAIVVWVRPGGESVATSANSDGLVNSIPTELTSAEPISTELGDENLEKPADEAVEPEVAEPEVPQAEVAEPETTRPAAKPIDPRTKGVVIKKSSPAARAKGEITFDDLQFKIEKDAKFSDDLLDDDVKSLDGLDVRLSGYILPSTLFKETDIDQFVLVRDNQECCFGPGAALFDCVIVEMQDGNTTDFVTRPVTVYGNLQIDTKKYKYPGGKGPRGTTHFAIFRIEGQRVE